MHGALAIVERWHAAVNARDAAGCLAVCAEDIELVGPRGVARGHAMVEAWLARAGFTAAPLRWFCGGDGRVVVLQDAHWREHGDATVTSAYVVRHGRIVRHERFDELHAALATTGLTAADEVVRRAPGGDILPP